MIRHEPFKSKVQQQLEQELAEKALLDEALALDTVDREDITRTVRQIAANKRPRNPVELFQWIKNVLGYELAYTSTEEGYEPPLEVVWAFFSEVIRRLVWRGGRGTGKTLNKSITHVLNSTFKPGCDTVHGGSTRTQANDCQKYLANHASVPEVAGMLVGNPTKSLAVWKNGSRFEVRTATARGVCIAGDSGVITDRGVVPIKRLVGNLHKAKALSFNFSTGKTEWREILKGFDNGPETAFVRPVIRNQSTANLPSMTVNHEVYLVDGSKKRAGELKYGDSVAVREFVFSHEQQQILIGSLLGDGSIDSIGRLYIVHGASQAYYLDWKVSAMAPGMLATYRTVRGGFGTTCRSARFRVGRETRELRSQWYSTGKKTVPNYVTETLDILGLAIWLMDDGCFGGRYWTIYVNCFDAESIERLRSTLCRWDIESTVLQDSKNAPTLYISADSSRRLTQLVSKYIDVTEKQPSGWKRWIAPEIRKGDWGVGPGFIERVDQVSLRNNRKFDITVEGNHNYFLSSGQLVSNSGAHPNKFAGDEVEWWPWEALMQALGCAQPKNGIEMGVLLGSTEQKDFGSMRRLTKNAAKMGYAVMTTSIFEVMQPCPTCLCIKGDRVNPKNCILWEDCKGIRARKATGHLPLIHVQDRCIEWGGPGSEDWITQGLCQRPSRKATIYPHYEPEIDWPYGNNLEMDWTTELPVWLSVDPSGAKNYVVSAYQYHENIDHLHKFDEIIFELGATTYEAKLEVMKKPWASFIELVVIDGRRVSDIKDWKMAQKGMPSFNAKASIIKQVIEREGLMAYRKNGIARMKARILDPFGRRRFTAHGVNCTFGVNQMAQYHYPVDKASGQVRNDEPADEYSDGPDTDRYMNDFILVRYHRHKGKLKDPRTF